MVFTVLRFFEKKNVQPLEICISFSPNYSEINWAIVGLKEKNLLALAFARGRTSTELWKKVKTFTFRLRCQTEPEQQSESEKKNKPVLLIFQRPPHSRPQKDHHQPRKSTSYSEVNAQLMRSLETKKRKASWDRN